MSIKAVFKSNFGHSLVLWVWEQSLNSVSFLERKLEKQRRKKKKPLSSQLRQGSGIGSCLLGIYLSGVSHAVNSFDSQTVSPSRIVRSATKAAIIVCEISASWRNVKRSFCKTIKFSKPMIRNIKVGLFLITKQYIVEFCDVLKRTCSFKVCSFSLLLLFLIS